MSKIDGNGKSNNNKNIHNDKHSGSGKAGENEFKKQMEELESMSMEATARSVQLRTVMTNLQTIKKAADERVS
ncbi:hypothetical protein [Mesorhizobium onobrychidis]|uniref:Nodulation protein NopA n=1 Tax=Mesorhizobium onobrychidis TaxID=2775404 RepID=A0ABY5QX14_9HYPH|nr:hypothetical protein [Mesorhizobium onobrychidis]UVC15251.1 hypothetical protein IHQ72_32670 [Mesorhizobium onobrychidis]